MGLQVPSPLSRLALALPVSEPIKKFPARHVVFRDLLAPKPVKIPLGAVWKKNGLYSEVVSKFVTTLSQACSAVV